MPRNVTGTSSILKASRDICRLVGRFGTATLAAETSPPFALAVGALVLACGVLETVDDHPYVVDATAPTGPEDLG